ncbi:MAG: O-antigen ligase family protein [Acidobacteriota bacterium]
MSYFFIILFCLAVFFFPDRKYDYVTFIIYSILILFFISKKIKSKNFLLRLNVIHILFLSLLVFSILSSFFTFYKYPSIIRILDLTFIIIAYLSFSYLNKREEKFFVDFSYFGIFVLSVYSTLKYFIKDELRASANFLNPNHFAIIVLFGIIIGIIKIFYEKKNLLLHSLLTLFMTVSLLFVKSRSAFLSFFVLLFLFIYIKNKKYLVLVPVLIALLLLIPNPFSKFFFELTKSDPFAFARIKIWLMDLEMFKDHLLVGVGANNFPHAMPPYIFPNKNLIAHYGIAARQAHNNYLEILAELGIGGFVFLFGIVYFILKTFPSIKKDQNGYILMSYLALLSIFINAFFQNCFFHPSIPLYSMIFLSLILKNTRNLLPELIRKEFRMKKLPLVFSLIFLWLITAAFPASTYYYFYEKTGKALAEKDIVNATKYIKRSIFLTPLNARFHYDLGKIYSSFFIQTKNLEILAYADEKFKHALRLNPKYNEAAGELGFLYFSLFKMFPTEENYQKTILWYTKAMELNPKYPFYPFALGNFFLDVTGEDKKAENFFRKAIEIEPNFVGAHLRLIEIHKFRKDKHGEEKEKRIVKSILERIKGQEFEIDYFQKILNFPEKYKEILD